MIPINYLDFENLLSKNHIGSFQVYGFIKSFLFVEKSHLSRMLNTWNVHFKFEFSLEIYEL